MPVILSLTEHHDEIWALGPEGLFLYKDGGAKNFSSPQAMPQPDHHPSCCYHDGERLLVGGATHGVAYTTDDGGWRASWMDGVTAPVVCLAPHPHYEHTGVLLAGSSGGGILRSANRGRDFFVCNFGLIDFDVLALAWAPPQPRGDWPPLEIVFAGASNGVYRSPNAGRGWKQVADLPAPVLSLAVSSAFHYGGPVLAGTEGAGLWRSDDGGYTFCPIPDTPEVINALLALPDGWLLSDAERIWRSQDGNRWKPLDLPPALTFLRTQRGTVLAGGMEGVFQVE